MHSSNDANYLMNLNIIVQKINTSIETLDATYLKEMILKLGCEIKPDDLLYSVNQFNEKLQQSFLSIAQTIKLWAYTDWLEFNAAQYNFISNFLISVILQCGRQEIIAKF